MAPTSTGRLPTVRSSVEPLEDNRVKLTVVLDEAEFDAEIDAAFKRIAREVRIRGFRPGRAPRRLLEAQLGSQTGRSEALRTSLPDYYAKAVRDHDVDVIDAPEIEITEGAEDGPVIFDAVVEVRPSVLVSGYDNLTLEIPSPVVEAAEVDDEIDRFLGQFAELTPVSRASRHGDHLTVEISGALAGEVVDGLTTTDYDYRLGSGAVVPEIDENLSGASAGDILEFSARHPDPDEERTLSFRVLVKEVQEPVLPDLDDEFVAANTEHATVEEFRGSLEHAQRRVKAARAARARHEALAQAVAALVGDEPPDAMVKADVEARLERLAMAAQQQGYEFEEYLTASGQTREQVVAELGRLAAQDVRVDLALRAVAVAEGLEADEAAVDAELRRIITGVGNPAGEPDGSTASSDRLADEGADDHSDEQAGESAGDSRALEHASSGDDTADDTADDAISAQVERLRSALAVEGRLSAMRAELSKMAAFEWISQRAELLDPAGQVVDPQLLMLPETDAEASGAQDLGGRGVRAAADSTGGPE